MFESFAGAYRPVLDETSGVSSWTNEILTRMAGYSPFSDQFAGSSFGKGLLRVHDAQTGPVALELVDEAFPELQRQVCPFAYDWLGRQFASDARRVVNGEPQVLLLEPGASQALEVPCNFMTFIEDELVQYADAALAVNFFDQWSALHKESLPLARDECVGYQVPLFLGGLDVTENLEVSDIAVYWAICAQLRRGTLKLKSGTTIGEISPLRD